MIQFIFKRSKKFYLSAFLSLAIVCGMIGFYRITLLQCISSFLVYESTPQKSDILCVLGGGGAVRLEKAIELCKAGYAEKIFIASPEVIPPEALYHDLLDEEKRIFQAIIEYYEIPADKIIWSTIPFYSTHEELTYINAMMSKDNMHSAIIIPGWFQSRRAKWTISRFLDKDKTILIIPAPITDYSPEEWWTNLDGVITVENECLKNLYYLIRYI